MDPTSLADEKVTLLRIPIKLSEPSTSSVDYQVTGGSSTAVADFSFIGGGPTGGTITFAGDTANIEVTFAADTMEEANETVEITLANPQGATIGEQATHLITISSDILPRVSFSNAVTSKTENLAAPLDLELDIAPMSPVSVDIVLAGNATATADYGLTAQTVTFAAGQTTAQLDYAVVSDDRDESNELITVDLASPIGLVIDTTAAHTEHTILDDDDTPTVAFVNATNSQAEGVPDADQIVQLSAASNLTVTVAYAASGQAANASDLVVGGNGTLTFLPGETMQEIPLTITDNTTDELLNETAVITLSAPTNATLGTNVTHTLTIVDDDPPPSFTFATASTTVTENGADLALTVTLSEISDLPVTVDFAPGAASTATLTSDFTLDPATLTFAPGDLSKTITVGFVDNAAGEIDETIEIVLSSTNGTPG
ncbi:MAG: hypothetical protein H0V17_06585, partial [Deltaproteobacteria bacterium]|nr:hypothetical protein [Deltaproteobacteria bacterium]